MSARPRSFVLTYHSLDAGGSVISTDPSVFREQMSILARQKISVVPLGEIRHRPGAVALTFDDAFASVAEVALPVLERHGFPATIFAVSGYTGRRNDWPSQPSGIPVLPLMSWNDLAEASRRGFEIGAHTVTHPKLGSLSLEEAGREMVVSAAEIREHTGIGPRSFAYPYGDAPAQIRDLAARHFPICCTTVMGPVTSRTAASAITRIDTFYLRSPFWFERLFRAPGRAYLAGRTLLRSVREFFSEPSRRESRKLQIEQQNRTAV